jgi:hypothetical protein
MERYATRVYILRAYIGGHAKHPITVLYTMQPSSFANNGASQLTLYLHRIDYLPLHTEPSHLERITAKVLAQTQVSGLVLKRSELTLSFEEAVVAFVLMSINDRLAGSQDAYSCA